VAAPSLTIVLPAYNEAARLGPALDELFGYLGRHGTRGPDGAPGAAALPANVRILTVDDGSTDDSAALVRPEAVTVELVAVINTFTCQRNEASSPFTWGKTPDETLAEAVRKPRATNGLGHR
jgi:hypothetical protein